MQAVPLSLALLGAILPDSLYRDIQLPSVSAPRGSILTKKKKEKEKKDLFLAPEKSLGFFSTEER